MKGKLKQDMTLTDDDLSSAQGKEDELLGRHNGDWESPMRIFALRSRNYSQTQLLGLASALINHQALMAPPAAKIAPANMTARKPATKE